MLTLQEYCAKYEYASFELLETNTLFEYYMKIFIDEYSKLIEQKSDPIEKETNVPNAPNEPNVPNVPNEPNEPNEPDAPSKPNEPKNKLLKRIYKQLSLLTHPDKQNGTDELFKIVKEAYDTNNILKLITIAVKFKIEIPEDIDSTLWDDEILKMTLKIEYLKKTNAWLWANASENEKQKIFERILSKK